MDVYDLLGLATDLEDALRQLREFRDTRRAIGALERVREKVSEAIDRAGGVAVAVIPMAGRAVWVEPAGFVPGDRHHTVYVDEEHGRRHRQTLPRQVFRGEPDHCRVIAAAFARVGYADVTGDQDEPD